VVLVVVVVGAIVVVVVVLVVVVVGAIVVVVVVLVVVVVGAIVVVVVVVVVVVGAIVVVVVVAGDDAVVEPGMSTDLNIFNSASILSLLSSSSTKSRHLLSISCLSDVGYCAFAPLSNLSLFIVAVNYPLIYLSTSAQKKQTFVCFN
jgi:hypothetical protein